MTLLDIEEHNGIKYGFWALQRSLTRTWGSGQVFDRLSKNFGSPDIVFGKTDNIPGGVMTVDNNVENNPTYDYDWNSLPFKDNEFEFGYWDPPYDKLYKHEGIEIWRTVRKIAILHTHIWPRAWLETVAKANRIGMIGITMGPLKQIRCLQVFEKEI